MTRLDSPANPRVKGWLRLRDRAERERTGMTIVDGRRELERALASGAELVEVAVGPRAGTSEDGLELRDRLEAAGVACIDVSEGIERRLGFGDRSEGFVGIVRVPPLGLDRLALPASPLVVVLDALEKPGNLGAVLRTADAAGADALVLSDPVTDAFNPNAIRASLGTIFSVPLAAAPGEAVRSWLPAHGLRVVVARVDGSHDHTDADLRGPTALVLGSEAHGLGPAWDDDDVVAVRIPMLGIADSLNVSVAAAILLYEARRQRDADTD
jgi:TrmH family RNA methyltransferase